MNSSSALPLVQRGSGLPTSSNSGGTNDRGRKRPHLGGWNTPTPKHERLKPLKKMSIALLSLSLMTGCSGISVQTVSDSCGWVKVISLDAGALERLTAAEKRAILAHNEKVRRLCR